MIPDASVATKWFVVEADTSIALKLLTRTDLVAPSHFDLEVANAATRMVRQGVISPEGAQDLLGRLIGAPVARIPWEALREEGFNLSLVLGAAFYDCLYLALALQRDDILVTADARFVRAVQSRPALKGRAVLLADL
jgi:predicted nucleic acid-binding protein